MNESYAINMHGNTGGEPLQKPKSAYTLFMQRVSDSMKDESDSPHKGSFMTLVAKKWRELGDAERMVYIDEANKQKEEYDKHRAMLDHFTLRDQQQQQ